MTRAAQGLTSVTQHISSLIWRSPDRNLLRRVCHVAVGRAPSSDVSGIVRREDLTLSVHDPLAVDHSVIDFQIKPRRDTRSFGLLMRKGCLRWPNDLFASLFASSFARARIGADRYSGSQAFSVDFRSLRRAPSMLTALGGENSLSNSPGPFRPRPASSQTGRPSSSAPRDRVDGRYCGQIELVFDHLALEHPCSPIDARRRYDLGDGAVWRRPCEVGFDD